MVHTMEIDRSAVSAAVARGHLCATELADYLVGAGVPFRQAHDIVGGLVRLAEERGVELPELALEDYRAASSAFGGDLYEWLDVARAVNRRDLAGGPAQKRVASEIARVRAELGQSDQNGEESR
jgi:argininosuccinate lyase